MSSAPTPANVIRTIRENRSTEQIRIQKLSGETKILPYSRRDYYKIWITTAGGHIHYATRTVALDAPALIFSNPRVPYSFQGERANEGYMCIFTEEFTKVNGRSELLQDAPLFRIGANSVFLLDEQQLTHVAGIFDRMISEFNSGYQYRFEVIRHHVNLLMHEAMKMEPVANQTAPHNAPERITRMFLELLERQFPIRIHDSPLKLRKPADYAEGLSIHVNHLNSSVRQITGKSTTAHISARIIAEAKALLLNTDLTINEIAYCLGFGYANYFTSFFKKHTGSTPLSLRR